MQGVKRIRISLGFGFNKIVVQSNLSSPMSNFKGPGSVWVQFGIKNSNALKLIFESFFASIVIINWLTTKKNTKNFLFSVYFHFKATATVSIGDMATSIFVQLLDSFWYRFHKFFAALNNFLVSVPHVNYSINELR